MIAFLIVAGVLCIFIGLGFFWLNLNTPYQTFLPAVFIPFGAVLLVLSIGGLLL